MIDPTLFESEWFVNLGVDERYMYLYLLVNASNKTGVFEWNERMINFCANTNRKFSKQDILTIYGNRIQMVPGRNSTMIIVDYIRFNWLKDGRELDPVKNRLDRAILRELTQYGLTVEKLNEMSKHKIKEVLSDGSTNDDCGLGVNGVFNNKGVDIINTSVTDKDMDELFAAFWNAYPGLRKQDKKKVRAKFEKIIGTNPDKAVSMFNKIMNGLAKWKTTDTWTKDGGQYVCTPLVWLNNERWDAEITGGANGTACRKSGTANTNYKSADVYGIF